MATLTVTAAAKTGNDITTLLTAAASGGDAFTNTGKEILLINNGTGSSITLTIAVQVTPDGLTLPNRTVTITANKLWAVGPFPVAVYNDTNSRVVITYSSVTTITVAVLQLTPV